MASKGGSIGRSEERSRKPPLPSFGVKKTSKVADAAKNKEEKAGEVKKEEVKNDQQKEEVKHDDTKADNGSKGESKTDSADAPSRVNSTIHRPQSKTETTKSDATEVKKTVVRTKEVPSRYMSSNKASPRPSTSTTEKKPPIPKSHTPTLSSTSSTSTSSRTKTPDRNAKTPDRNAKTPERNTKTPDRNTKTPTKSQPATPRITTTTNTTLGRTSTNAITTKRITPTPTAVGTKKHIPPSKTPEPKRPTEMSFPSPGDRTPKQKEETIHQINNKITELQTELKSLTLLRDSIYFQQNPSEESESDWDPDDFTITSGSENSSEVGDDRDDKYADMVRRYRSTLTVLSSKIQLLKNALTDTKSEYDNLQVQHNKLLADMNKVKSASSDAVAVS